MNSIWEKTEKMPERELLPGNIDVDTAIIGGGMAGILTAHYLGQQGIEAVVLEADRVGSGQTGNTTAKITSQHGLIYNRLIRQFGQKRAGEYALLNQQAIKAYADLAKEIPCSFQRLPSVLYTERFPEKLSKEYRAAQSLGIQAELGRNDELPFPVQRTLRFENQAQFHPLRFLRGVSKKVNVYEKTRVERVEGQRLLTNRGVVRADKVVFACHYPFVNFPGFYFTRLHQERSYVLALEGPPCLSAMYYGIDPNGLSLRTAEEKLLLGGEGRRTGESDGKDPYDALWKRAKTFWPSSRIYARYSAQDCMPLDGVPYIGRFSPTKPNWYVATGFHKWGMTGSMVSALLLTRQIAGDDAQKRSVFSPRRFVPSAAVPSLIKEVGKSGKGLLKGILYFPGKEFDKLPKGQGAVIRWCGKKRGAYRDDDGTVYLVSTRCPHLGCQLEWDQSEKTWECPCHGSRFDFRGNLLNGPAQTPLKHASHFMDSSREID